MAKDVTTGGFHWVHDATLGEVVRASHAAGVPLSHGMLKVRRRDMEVVE